MIGRRIFAYLFLWGAVLAGVVQNYRFAQSLSDDGATNWPFVGGVALAAAGKVGIPLFAKWYRNGWLAATFALCVAFDLLCAIGYGSITRGSRLEEYESAIRLHNARVSEVRRLETGLAAAPAIDGPARPADAERESTKAAAHKMGCAGRAANSNECAVAMAPFNSAVSMALASEARAKRRDEVRDKLSGELDAARKLLAEAPMPTKSPDPQAAQLARAFGISERSASMIQTYFLAAVIEASLFGGAAALELSQQDRAPTPRPSPKRAPAAPGAIGVPANPKARASNAALLALLRGIKDGKVAARGLTVSRGSIEGPLEAWAAAMGIASKSTARRRLSELDAAGDVKAAFARTGTRVDIA